MWRKYNGNKKDGKCYVCRRVITDDNFDVGHNKAKSKGGYDNIDNLRPICRPCNDGMGNRYTIEKYKAKFFGGKAPKKVKSKKRRTGRTREDPDPLGLRKFRLPKYKFRY